MLSVEVETSTFLMSLDFENPLRSCLRQVERSEKRNGIIWAQITGITGKLARKKAPTDFMPMGVTQKEKRDE
jgi:hypothetical protein